ncbi:MAG TPA: MFS transporter [Actinocrinis sp.]|uniref:MFS transporter n=1 Tax=Actinocrinis sp. TaxID=1920516 RepID=UPI002D406C1F|nr:MFS transporter [Actinocrinis sp.]HZU56597.1 MFS transporter [Actinocrinis sp.]
MSVMTRPHHPVPAAPPARPRRRLALAVLCVSLLIVTLDNTILNIALPALVRAMHATDAQLQWIVDAYAVVFGGLLLIAGTVADRVGRRRVFLAGLLLFAAGSAAAAFSGTVTELICARAGMGLGAACIMPATLSIIADLFREPRERAQAIGLWSATSGLGIALGPIVGGWLLERYWWGSVFFVNVPIALAGAAAAIWLVPDSRDPVRRPLDAVGAPAATAGLLLLLWAIIESPVRGWHSGMVLSVGGAGLVVLLGFALWERYTPSPMLVVEAFRDRRFSVAMGSVAMAIFALMGALFVLTQYLQFSLGYSAFAAGVRILPVAGLLAVTAPLSTVLDRRLGTKTVVATALAVIAGGLLWLSRLTVSADFGHTLPGLLLLGAGAGLAIAPATASVIGSLPPERAGVGSATNGTALQTGGALGVAVLGSTLAARYQGQMTAALTGHAVPPAAAHAITGSLGGALGVAGQIGGTNGALLAAAGRAAFLDGMHLAATVAAVVVAVGALLVLIALPSRAARS